MQDFTGNWLPVNLKRSLEFLVNGLISCVVNCLGSLPTHCARSSKILLCKSFLILQDISSIGARFRVILFLEVVGREGGGGGGGRRRGGGGMQRRVSVHV